MSTKTLRKRIALVAVSAMGFGLLTSVAANAAAGITVAANGATSTTSRGIVTGTTGSALTGTTNTMTVLSGGSLYVTAGGGSSTGAVTVSGGAITSCAGDTVTLSSNQTSCKNSGTADVTATIVPTAAGTNVVISRFASNDTTASATDVITVSVVASSTVNVFSQGDSNFSTETSATSASDNTDATWTPTGGTSPSAAATDRNDGAAGYLGWSVKDGNGNALTSPVIVASTTGGCLLNAGTDSAGNMSSAYSSTAASYVRVDQPTAHAPATCTVSLTVNGTAAASRTFTFRGQVASIKVTSVAVVKAKAAATSNAIYAAAYDSAGNALTNISVAPDTSYYNANLTSVGTVTTAPWGTGATDGSASITCGNSSANKMVLKTTNASAATIKSAEFTINCSGDPANYTATLDKPSYVPGDIAVLTITAKDSSKALTNDAATLGSTASPVAIAGSNLTAVSAPTNADTFTSGVKTYKFIVGSTEGAYQLSVDLPLWNSSTYSQSAVTVAYKISSGSASVTNAQVLAAIVKLIASINKQILALQKALKK